MRITQLIRKLKENILEHFGNFLEYLGKNLFYNSPIGYIIIFLFVLSFFMGSKVSPILNSFSILCFIGYLIVTFIGEKRKIGFFLEIIVFSLILTDGIAIFAPYFFNWMGFNVTNMGNSTITIDASDATNYMLSSILTIVIGFLFLNMKKE